MATVNITWGGVGGGSPDTDHPVINPRVSENITPDSTSNASSNAAAPTGNEGFEIAQITTDTAIRVAIGEGTPVAADATGILMLASTTRDFFVPTGQKVAVLTATL